MLKFMGKGKILPERSSPSSSQTEKDDKKPKSIFGYRLEKTIGKGTFGKVYLATDIHSSQRVAIKVINQSHIKNSKERKNVSREIKLMKILNHPHIIKVIDIVKSKGFTNIIMEYASNGELHDYIVEKKGLSEDESRKIFRQIVSVVDYIHESSIVHRDLKPENLLIDHMGDIKLIDFGFGNTFMTGQKLSTYCGSPFYAAPEMTQGIEYCGPEVDAWSMGVILYMMTAGDLPFRGTNIGELYDSICSGKFPIPSMFSKELVDIISLMLKVDPDERIKVKDLKKHPWVNVGYGEEIDSHVPPRPVMMTSYDKNVFGELLELGYDRRDCEDALLNNPVKTPIKSLYYLHQENKTREQNEKQARDKLLGKKSFRRFLINKLRLNFLNKRNIRNQATNKEQEPTHIVDINVREELRNDLREDLHDTRPSIRNSVNGFTRDKPYHVINASVDKKNNVHRLDTKRVLPCVKSIEEILMGLNNYVKSNLMEIMRISRREDEDSIGINSIRIWLNCKLFSGSSMEFVMDINSVDREEMNTEISIEYMSGTLDLYWKISSDIENKILNI